MPISSAQISANIGMFQQQTLMTQQQAAMLSQMYGGQVDYGGGAARSGLQGEQLAGRGINTLAAYGAPTLGAIGSLSGMTSPLGGAIGGAMAGAFAGPLGMVGGAALGGAVGTAGYLGSQTLGYMAEQGMTGMQQQQMFSSQMRSALKSAGGGTTNMSTGQLGDISDTLRQMSMGRGTGGESTSFSELSQLASNSMRMGLIKQVKDAQDFKQKFGEMMTSVKEIATAMSTSLEEAQKVMATMKQSGIFKGQGAFAGQMHDTAIAGNISLQEVSSSARMGSQISRMYGGLGSAGARGGMLGIGQVANALQAGAIDESDIYNSTGLTGAEGRQAFVQQHMSMTGRFLRSGLGRRVVAAVANKDGQIDEGAMSEIMQGGMGTGRTMESAYGHLGKTGRANFIRNEGHLRGEVMGKMGVLGMANVARGWLQSRNMNLDNMNDRQMLFFQRKFGLGRDESDTLIKMARSSDLIEDRKQQRLFQDQARTDMDAEDKLGGVEGIKKRIEDARNRLNGRMQQAGADLYQDASNSINSLINRVMGTYEKRVMHDVIPDVRKALRAGHEGADHFEKMMQGPSGLTQADRTRGNAMFGSSRDLSGVGLQSYIAANNGRVLDAGYTLSGASSAQDVRSRLDMMNSRADAFRNTTSSLSVGGEASASLRNAFSSGAIAGKGALATESFARYAEGSGNAELRKLAAQMRTADPTEQARILARARNTAGFSGSMGGMMDSPFATTGLSQSKYATEAERAQAYGNAMGSGFDAGSVEVSMRRKDFGQAAIYAGRASEILSIGPGGVHRDAGVYEDMGGRMFDRFTGSRESRESVQSTARGLGRRLVGGAFGALGSAVLGDAAANFMDSSVSRVFGLTSSKSREAMGRAFSTRESFDEFSSAISSDKSARADAVKSAQDRAAKILERSSDRTMGGLTDGDQGLLMKERVLMAAGQYQDITSGQMSDKERQAKLSELARSTQFGSVGAMQEAMQNARGALSKEADTRRDQFTDAYKKSAGRQLEGMGMDDYVADLGDSAVDVGRKSRRGEYEFQKKISSRINSMRGLTDEQKSRLAGNAETILKTRAQALNAEKADPNSEEAKSLRKAAASDFDSVINSAGSSRELYALGAAMGGTDEGRSARSRANSWDRFRRAGGPGGDASAAAGMLGVDLSRKDFLDRQTGRVRTLEEQASMTIGASGVTGAAGKQMEKQLLTILEAAKSGDNADAAKKMEEFKQQHGEKIQKAQQEQQQKKESATNPSYRALTSIDATLKGGLKVHVVGEVKTTSGGGGANKEGKVGQ